MESKVLRSSPPASLLSLCLVRRLFDRMLLQVTRDREIDIDRLGLGPTAAHADCRARAGRWRVINLTPSVARWDRSHFHHGPRFQPPSLKFRTLGFPPSYVFDNIRWFMWRPGLCDDQSVTYCLNCCCYSRDHIINQHVCTWNWPIWRAKTTANTVFRPFPLEEVPKTMPCSRSLCGAQTAQTLI
jgi:hypothetical protein